MNVLIAIAAGVVAYGAPDHRDALDAVQQRMIDYWSYNGKQVDAYAHRPEAEYPADVTLEQCQRRTNWRVRMVNGAESYRNGYECLLEIWPNGFPAFRVDGFFYFNGEGWTYFGPLHPLSAPPRISDFDPSNDEGDLILKDGAQTYDGFPSSPYYDNYDPYQELFDLNRALSDQN